jgi:hypothetical protein
MTTYELCEKTIPTRNSAHGMIPAKEWGVECGWQALCPVIRALLGALHIHVWGLLMLAATFNLVNPLSHTQVSCRRCSWLSTDQLSTTGHLL